MFPSRAVIFSVPGQAEGTIPVFSGSAWEGLNPGTAGQYLKTRGPGLTPIWATPPTSGGSDKVRDEGTLTTSGSFSLTLPGIASFLGIRVIEINLALSDGASHQSASLRVTLSSALAELDAVLSFDGTGSFYDAGTGLSYADSAGDLVITVPVLVGSYSVMYRASAQEA